MSKLGWWFLGFLGLAMVGWTVGSYPLFQTTTERWWGDTLPRLGVPVAIYLSFALFLFYRAREVFEPESLLSRIPFTVFMFGGALSMVGAGFGSVNQFARAQNFADVFGVYPWQEGVSRRVLLVSQGYSEVHSRILEDWERHLEYPGYSVEARRAYVGLSSALDREYTKAIEVANDLRPSWRGEYQKRYDLPHGVHSRFGPRVNYVFSVETGELVNVSRFATSRLGPKPLLGYIRFKGEPVSEASFY